MLRFPNAQHLVSHLDYPSAASPSVPRSPGQRVLELVGGTGRLSLVAGWMPVADGVTLVPAPGETAGHLIVDVDLGSGRVIYAGDLFHFACEFEHIDWMPMDRAAAAMIASRESVIELATATGASVVFTHADFPAWGTCRWERRPRARWTPDAGA